ncbi:MAG: hypothetical protein R6X14_03625 [bacterium]
MIRKIAAATIVLGMVAVAFAASVSTGNSNTVQVPTRTPALEAGECHFTEKTVWMMNECGEWQEMPVGGLGNRARAWSYEILYEDSCNKVNWPVGLKNEAAVAQWMIIKMNNDGFHWAVRKPGDYVADCVKLSVRSNSAIEISLSGFEHLMAVDENTIDSVIEVRYAFVDQGDVPPPYNDSAWLSPEACNETSWRIEDSYDLHWIGHTTHIWSSIHVGPCNGPTEYVDRDWAIITASLVNQQPWIDPETGLFQGMPEFPFQL